MDDNANANASAKGTARNACACACPAPAPYATADESSQNQKHLVAYNYNDFINHSFNHSINHNHSVASAYSYAYDPVQAQAGRPPFVDYSHHHNRGGGPYNPHPWHNHQHFAAFAGHYGVPQLQPQTWPQPWPQPQTRLPATDQLGLDHRYSSGGDRSVDFTVVKLCFSPSPSASQGPCPGPIECPSIKPYLQQRQRSHSAHPPSLELNHQLQLQPGRSSSLSLSHYHPPHGEYVPLLVNVRKLRDDETLKTKIDNEDVLVMMDYGSANNQNQNQMNRGYPYPHSASMPNRCPPPPGTVADASTCQESGTGSYSYPAAVVVAARPKKDLFVFHVPNDMAEGEFYNLFSQYGNLRRARIHHDIIDGKKVSKGYGFVTFKRFSDAVVAVHSLNGYKVGEKNKKALAVTYCRDTPRPDPTNNSSVNNGTNRSSSDKRKSRHIHRRLST